VLISYVPLVEICWVRAEDFGVYLRDQLVQAEGHILKRAVYKESRGALVHIPAPRTRRDAFKPCEDLCEVALVDKSADRSDVG